MCIAITSASIHRKQAGYCYVGSRFCAEELLLNKWMQQRIFPTASRAANCAHQHANLLIVNVPRLRAEELAKELGAIGRR